MVYFLQQVLVYAIPLLIVALGGVFAERSGIINIALEGIMVFGAFVGVMVIRFFIKSGFTPSEGQLLLIIVIIITMIAGGLFAALLAFASVNLKADQTIGSTALNLLAPALVLFLILLINSQSSINIGDGLSPAKFFMLKYQDFGFESLEQMNPLEQLLFHKVYLSNVYCIVIYVVLSIILYKTKLGLRLRSCGEHPHAANSLGINVNKMRYIGTIISGMLAALGGFVYCLSASSCNVNGDVGGVGFLALAVMIFGNWKPLNIAFAALLFGSLKCLSASYPYIDINGDGIYFLKDLGISTYVYRVMPYVITLIVLAFTSKKSRAPKAEGIPFDKSKR